MLNYIDSINLIRYVIVWRVNSSLVFLPKYLSLEISNILGEIIAKRLPTKDAIRWKKALGILDNEERKSDWEKTKKSHQTSWPIDAIILNYPEKRTYGRDELIIWELKLFGESADHELFLEIILPAMEEAGYTSDSRWKRSNHIWGHFDIHSVYVAKGNNLEPLVTNGILNLQYRANPNQWFEGLDFGAGLEHKFEQPTHLKWIMPFDLKEFYYNESKGKKKKKGKNEIPNLKIILEAFEHRIKSLIPGISDLIVAQEALEQSDNTSIIHKNILKSKDWSGFLTGTQLFSGIPSVCIPYLELASIIHIGNQTHFGCGTYALIRSTKELK